MRTEPYRTSARRPEGISPSWSDHSLALAIALTVVRAAERRCVLSPPTAVERLCASIRIWPTVGAVVGLEGSWVVYQIIASHLSGPVFDPVPCALLQRANLLASVTILTVAACARSDRQRREEHQRQRIAHWVRDLEILAIDLASIDSPSSRRLQ